MMDMMNTTGIGSGYTLLWGFHIFSVIVFFVGILLLVLWAVKTLTQGQLKTWGISLIILGIVVCLVTIGIRGAPWTMYGQDMNMQMMGRMMKYMGNDMMDEDEQGRMMGGHDMRDEDMMDMSMEDMSTMLEGKTGDAFDAAFIEGMIPHHQGAIDMARAALESAGHEEIKAMARAIITAQQSEIDQMKQWQQSWGYTQ